MKTNKKPAVGDGIPALHIVTSEEAVEISRGTLVAAQQYLIETRLGTIYIFGGDYSTFAAVPRSASFIALSREEIEKRLGISKE